MSGSVHTSEGKDSIKIYFRGGESTYDPELRDNRVVLSVYLDRIKKLNQDGCLNNVVVEGYVSPDGRAAINERLAKERSHVLAEMIEQQAGVDRSKIETLPVGINWDELRRMIESDPNVPSRKALLDIIDNTPIWVFDKQGNIIGGRKKSMMDLRGGRPYRWLYTHLFPEMRNAVAISLNYALLPPPINFEPTDSAAAEKAASIDSVGEPAREVIVVTDSIIGQPLPADRDQAHTVGVMKPDHDPLHRLAIKTNLLYYPILLPNLEVEWRINDRWSVSLEGDVAWWGKYSNNRSYRLAIVSPEVRRWFRTRGPWHGFYAGAFAGGALYDFQKNEKRGYRGEGAMAGLSFGYMWPIARNFSFEAEVGAGYLYSRYKEYMPLDGHHVYQRTKGINYIGPLKLKFSIVWRFWDLNKPKRSNTAKNLMVQDEK